MTPTSDQRKDALEWLTKMTDIKTGFLYEMKMASLAKSALEADDKERG